MKRGAPSGAPRAACLALLLMLAASVAARADDPPTPADPGAEPPAPPVLPVLRPPAVAGALVLEGSLQTDTIDCAGRDVIVHADGGHYLLFGGCRSLWVQGRGNSIDAEMQPGARIAVGGADVVLRYAVVAAGPPPVLSVTAGNSQVTRVDRLGPDAAAPPPVPR
jgi:hypothetical protein